MFIAHHIAVWLGIPTGVLIIILLILRKRLKQQRARRNQQRQTAAPTTTLPGDSRGLDCLGRHRDNQNRPRRNY